MVDLAFLKYCRDDTLFFDLPAVRHEQDFPLVTSDLPEGWGRAVDPEWVFLAPDDSWLPPQGWKIHLSATLVNCSKLLSASWEYCRRERLAFKFIRSEAVLRSRNSKNGDRTASGKFVTIYPKDPSELSRALDELGTTLKGEPNPYILSDLRWENGPLYVRYGGFRLIWGRDSRGERVPCVTDPEGNLVPDLRRPGFRPPDWVKLPPALEPALAARRAGTLRDFPYQVQRALHFSNGGGVYEAIDARSGRRVLLKEARPFAGLDGDGRDAVERLRQEHWALERLRDVDCVPDPIELRRGNEHYFLARAFVEGTPLNQVVFERNPLLNGTGTEPTPYVDWALRIVDQVEAALTALHGHGVVFNDLHPNNILIRPDGEIAFIDLETACAVDAAHPPAMAAQGFSAPDRRGGIEGDRYALACVALAMFLPLTVLTAWGSEKVDQLVELVASHFPVPARFTAWVRQALEPADRTTTIVAADEAAPPLWPTPSTDTWPALRDSLVRGISDCAEPRRKDRLYPGDVVQLIQPGAGIGLAHGAAGVLWACKQVGAQLPDAHLAWLHAAIERSDSIGAGFGNGLCGIAYVLEELGSHDLARKALHRALQQSTDELNASLTDGLVGLALTMGYFAARDGDARLADAAAEAERQLEEFVTRYRPARPGLLHGPTGHALLLLAQFRRSGEARLLDRASELLTLDLELFGWSAPQAPWRHAHGLAGPLGTALVIDEFLRHRDQSDLRRARDAFRRQAHGRFVPTAGAWRGRAGTLLALQRLACEDSDSEAIGRHLNDLSWHVVRPDGENRAILSEQGLKLSTDLATGTAGVLVAAHHAVHRTPPAIPFLDLGAKPEGVR